MVEDYNQRVQFTRVRNVEKPARANAHDAGVDFYCPYYDMAFMESILIKNAGNRIFYRPVMKQQLSETGKVVREWIEDMEFIIPAGEQIMIPSGIKVWIEDKRTYLQATNKSGVASKFHLDVMANTIDADYQGEVHINLCNNGNTDIVIKTGQKLVQFIHQIYIASDLVEISNDDYAKIKPSDRGTGMTGSTGIFANHEVKK